MSLEAKAQSAKNKKLGEPNVKKHDLNIKRVARIKGQVEGIEKMLKDGRYCTDVLVQVKSVRSALKGLECAILENHIKGCVQKAFDADSSFEAKEKIDELIELIRGR